MCDTPHLRCTDVAINSCVYRSLRSVIHHLPHLCCWCVRHPRTYSGRAVRVKYEDLECPRVSDVLRFLAEPHPRNLDIRKHVQNTNNVTTPPINSSTSSSGPNHALVASPWCTAMASCLIGGCGPLSVITISLSCCAAGCACMCGVSCAPRKIIPGTI